MCKKTYFVPSSFQHSAQKMECSLQRNCPSICLSLQPFTPCKRAVLKNVRQMFVEKCLFHKISRIFKRSPTNKKFSRFLGILARLIFANFFVLKFSRGQISATWSKICEHRKNYSSRKLIRIRQQKFKTIHLLLIKTFLTHYSWNNLSFLIWQSSNVLK